MFLWFSHKCKTDPEKIRIGVRIKMESRIRIQIGIKTNPVQYTSLHFKSDSDLLKIILNKSLKSRQESWLNIIETKKLGLYVTIFPNEFNAVEVPDPLWLSSPWSRSVLGMWIRIQEPVNWPKLTKSDIQPFRKTFLDYADMFYDSLPT